MEPTLALFDHDCEADLQLEEVGFEPLPGCTRFDLGFASPAGGRVPAYLYVPDSNGPHAGILWMHGMRGDRGSSSSYAPRYAEAGAVVLAISAPWARGETLREETILFTEQDYHEQVQLIRDLRRGIDVLLTRPDVDPERLAFVGGSYGGAMGGLLAGVEERLKAYGLMIANGGLITYFAGLDELEENRPPPGISARRWAEWKSRMAPIEPIRFVSRAAPAHLFFQNGERDEIVPAPTARPFHEAASEPKTVRWYDAGHEVTPEMVEDQLRWLAERVGLRLGADTGS